MLLGIMLVIYEAPGLVEGVTALGLGREERSGASARSDVTSQKSSRVGTRAQIAFGTCRMLKQSVGHVQVKDPAALSGPIFRFFGGDELT